MIKAAIFDLGSVLGTENWSAVYERIASKLKIDVEKTKEIVENLKTADISTKQSFFAGTYVCNAVFYKTLAYIDENELSMRAGFIHVPLLASQDPDGMDLEMMVEAVTIAIQTSLD